MKRSKGEREGPKPFVESGTCYFCFRNKGVVIKRSKIKELALAFGMTRKNRFCQNIKITHVAVPSFGGREWECPSVGSLKPEPLLVGQQTFFDSLFG